MYVRFLFKEKTFNYGIISDMEDDEDRTSSIRHEWRKKNKCMYIQAAINKQTNGNDVGGTRIQVHEQRTRFFWAGAPF